MIITNLMHTLIVDVPVNLRVEAVKCALLLLPDEHREALHALLVFLNEVSHKYSTYNSLKISISCHYKLSWLIRLEILEVSLC